MAETTKEQLLEQIKQLNEALEDAHNQIEERDQKIQKLTAKDEGWLIIAPNPRFDGQVYGVTFVNGQAFIPRNRKVRAFDIPPVKDTVAKKYNLTPEQMAEVREREKISSAERAAMAIKVEFGYRVEYFDASRLAELQTVFDTRAQERAQVEAVFQQQLQASGLVAPNYLS